MAEVSFLNKISFLTRCGLYVLIHTVMLSPVISCNSEDKTTSRKKPAAIKKIAGPSAPIAEESAQKGEVLISYSDCYQCHAKDKKIVGPAFADIAKRYPANDTFITMLSQRIISGGNGVWGYPAMAPHPQISEKDARMMVLYILSLGR